MYHFINNAEMICIPFTLEHVRIIVSKVVIALGLIIGVIASSIIVFATSVVSNALMFAKYVIDELEFGSPRDHAIYVALALATLVFALMFKINDMLLDNIFKKIAYLTKENDRKTAKIEMLSRQIDSYWEKMNKTA